MLTHFFYKTSERALKDYKDKVAEFQKKYENSETLRTQEKQLSAEEVKIIMIFRKRII